MNMDLLRAQLTKHEGERLKPYRDTVGKLTIGIGRNLDDVGISHDEAQLLLTSDIVSAMDGLDRAFPWWRELSDVRQMVIVDMAFNMGLTTLSKFVNTLGAMERGEYDAASHGMLQSKWARQVGGRAQTLARMMKTGEL